MSALASRFQRALKLAADGASRLNFWLMQALAWLLLCMVLGQFLSVVLRYVFATGSIRLQESVLYLHALLFLLFAGGTLLADAHVRVDVFYRNWSPARQALVNGLGAVLCALPFCGFVFYSSWDYVQLAWVIREGSRETSGLPLIWLLKPSILLFALLLGAQSFALAVRAWEQWRRA